MIGLDLIHQDLDPAAQLDRHLDRVGVVRLLNVQFTAQIIEHQHVDAFLRGRVRAPPFDDVRQFVPDLRKRHDCTPTRASFPRPAGWFLEVNARFLFGQSGGLIHTIVRAAGWSTAAVVMSNSKT